MEKTTYEMFDQELGMWKPHLRFRGVWDMQDLYEFMVNYFRERKYHFQEQVYKHKHPSPFGIERQYVWKADRETEDLYAFHITTYIHTYDAHDIQVKMPDGRIRTFTEGRIWMEFSGKITILDDKRWAKSRFTANLRMFINNYILWKKSGAEIWDTLMYREMQRLVWLVRRRLRMEYDEYEQKDWTGVHA